MGAIKNRYTNAQDAAADMRVYNEARARQMEALFGVASKPVPPTTMALPQNVALEDLDDYLNYQNEVL